MTRYAELYRSEQEEKERLQAELAGEIQRLMEQIGVLRAFIVENKLEGKLARWATARRT